MSDREPFETARAAGKALQQQRRIETRDELRRRARREVAEEIALAVTESCLRPTSHRGSCATCERVAKLARSIGTKETS